MIRKMILLRKLNFKWNFLRVFSRKLKKNDRNTDREPGTLENDDWYDAQPFMPSFLATILH